MTRRKRIQIELNKRYPLPNGTELQFEAASSSDGRESLEIRDRLRAVQLKAGTNFVLEIAEFSYKKVAIRWIDRQYKMLIGLDNIAPVVLNE